MGYSLHPVGFRMYRDPHGARALPIGFHGTPVYIRGIVWVFRIFWNFGEVEGFLFRSGGVPGGTCVYFMRWFYAREYAVAISEGSSVGI